MLKLIKHSESFIFIDGEYENITLINDHFSFYAENYMFSPKYKAGIWDGKIYLFNKRYGLLPIGLLNELTEYCKLENIEIEIDDKLNNKGKKINTKTIEKFVNKILKCNLTPRDYQSYAVQLISYLQKCIILSATSSGKSFILFIIFNLLKYLNEDFKFLLIVPTVSLVQQMASDFCDYGKNFGDYNNFIHKITSGSEKNTDKPITISTWQSLAKQPKKYFLQYGVVFTDECFVGKTKITMEDGSYKKIKNINIGDKVMSYNFKSGIYEPKKVKEKYENLQNVDYLIELELENGKKIECTPNHKFYCKSNNGKIYSVIAENLTDNDEIIYYDNL